MTKLTYRAAAAAIARDYGIGMQQRRKRYGAPVAQYQLYWSQADSPATIHYVTAKAGITPEEIVTLAQAIADRVAIVRD